ncbi:MAG: NifB/NifX family molybdenum-iron cluster-binding protein [Bacteroidales bacterium]
MTNQMDNIHSPQNGRNRDKGAGKRHRHGKGQKEPQHSRNRLIAISAEDKDVKSKMDARFGRCNYFLIFNPENNTIEFVENPGKHASGGAGPMAAEMLVNYGVGKIMSGDFGPKASDALEAMNVEMVTLQDTEQTLESLIQKIQ